MTDEKFKEDPKRLNVPVHFDAARNIGDKILYALAGLGEATADQIIRRLEELEPEAENKLLIADTHLVLDELSKQGAINAADRDGEFIYNLK